MKKLLLILLVFISYNGFTQSIKLKEIGLQVMTKDLGEMTWYEAREACADLGDGWRLPTLDELKKIYPLIDKIGGFKKTTYWSKTDRYNDYYYAETFDFGKKISFSYHKTYHFYVRAVRSLSIE